MPDVGRLVTGKARRYLRTSTTLFCLSLCLIGTFLVVAESQYVQQRGDFSDNATVHLVRVTGPADPGGDGYLRFADITRVDDALSTARPGGGHDTTVVYTLGFGVPDAGGQPRFVYGIDGDGARLLGVPAVEDGVAYVSAPHPEPQLVLDVPVVQVEEGGMSSGAAVAHPLRAVGGVPADNPLGVLGDGDPSAVYVSGPTFRALVQEAFGVDWASMREQFDRDNVFGVQFIDDVYVHVPDLDDVKAVAETLTAAGYATNYTLKAFDDLAASLDRSAVLGLATVLATFLGCLVYVLLSVQSYLRVSHRDMAILRHAGFSAGEVGRMYGRRLLQIFVVVAAAAAVYQSVLAAWLLGDEALRFAALNILLCGLLLVFVCGVTLRGLVRRHARLDVLTLLRADREFE